MYIWMKVTNDKYELPVLIADTAKELALMCGVSTNTVYSCSWYVDNGKFNHSVYRRVQVDEEEE